MASITGYALLAIGLALLLFTFLLAYALYQSINSNGSNYNAPRPSGSNVTEVLASGLQNMEVTAGSSVYTVLSIVVLFLFANIGYKISTIGIDLINTNSKQQQQSKK